ncbi:MAG: endonuclease/exonuclease/phosphatase family protein [Asticcacaulis sp.]
MRLRRLFAALCLLCAVAPMLVAAICLSDSHRPLLYLIDIFTLPALSLSAVMAVAFLALRQPIAAGACAAAVLMFAAALMPQALPKQPPAKPGARHLRVVFANMFVRNPEQSRLLHFIAAQNPDIIAVVEANGVSYQVLFPSLDNLYPYHFHRGETAIYSRFPITNPWRAVPQSSDWQSLVTADIASNAGPIHLAVTHFDEPLPLGHNQQESQSTYIEAHAALPGERDTLIVGDFNSDFSAFRLKDIAQNLGLHALGAPSGSWPAFLPSFFRIAIDNAMAGPGWRLSHRVVSRPFGSDHRAIAFDLTPAA